MLKIVRIFLALVLMLNLVGCYDADEPNDIVYTVALGIDKGENPGEYAFTIQFARPAQISGGASMEGGKGGPESYGIITVNAPTIYSGLNLANHVISKRFTLAHMKLIVFSEEVAKDGVLDMADTIARSSDIRPDIYLCVAKGDAKSYLEGVSPVVEINPEKYYQLIFENEYAGYIPKNLSQDFYFYMQTKEKNSVLPLAAVEEKSEESSGDSSGGEKGESGGKESGGSSGGSGGASGGGSGEGESTKEQSGGTESPGSGNQGGHGNDRQGESGEQSQKSQKSDSGSGGNSESQNSANTDGSTQKDAQKSGNGSGSGEQGGEKSGKGGQEQAGQEQNSSGKESQEQKGPKVNYQGFEYRVKEYIAGNMDVEKKNKSEVLGLAVFKGDKMITELNAIESELFSIASGQFQYSFANFYAKESPNNPTTIRLQQEKHPRYRIDTTTDKPKIRLKVFLEGDFMSVTPYKYLENDIEDYQKEVSRYIKIALERFLKKTAEDLETDIVGFGSYAMRTFWTHEQFENYDWLKKYKDAEFEVDVSFKLHGTGLIVRDVEKKEEV